MPIVRLAQPCGAGGRPRAGYVPLSDPPCLRGFRGRADPRLPPVPSTQKGSKLSREYRAIRAGSCDARATSISRFRPTFGSRIISDVATPLEEYAQWVLHPQLPERPTQPRSSYFVCGTPRSGSWLLCGLLASTGIAGRPHEWFWRDTVQANCRAWGVARFSDYVARVRDAGTTPNGVFGSKVMWAYLDDLLARLGELGRLSSHRSLIERYFLEPRFVWIRREDLTAQAVSWAKAIQTGRWHHWDAPDPHIAPMYDREQIEALAREAAAHDAAWRAWFAANEIQPFAVHFEDLVADTVGVTHKVLGFLGVAAEGVPISELTITTSDRLNDEWLARYRS
jgi:LPS sulfotransferase NodH